MFIRVLVIIPFLLSCARAAITISPRNTAQQWKVAEFALSGVPTGQNNYDPDQISVRAMFVPAIGPSKTVDAFWFQNYTTTLNNGTEVLSASGLPEWRLRFMPDQAGDYQVTVTATNATTTVTGSTTFTVAPGLQTSPFKAPVNISTNRRYFEVAGETLPLNGANVCWHGNRGTFDYLDWFPAMSRNGENFARLWMCPWAFGIETASNSRTNYDLKHAWQLDRVMRIAETNGIFIMLCLEYHGMFQTQPDQFGGNNAWVQNPYNTANGGLCAAPNDFFTSTTARDIYKKRLRYVMARWGASPNLMAWEFFNEIDNDYNVLNGTDVANWHSALAPWLKQNDPYKRLVTTSLTGSSNRPEIWNIASLQFAQYHSYGLAQPASKLTDIIQPMMTAYSKPVFVSEYGIDSGGIHADQDPYFRGLRQGVWTGLLGLSPGTAMSWWWEEIHARNLYPFYNSVRQFLNKTALGKGTWTPIAFVTNGDAPTTVGAQIPDALPFTATLTPNGQWGFRSLGAMALTDPDAATRAPAILNDFFHGSAHSDLLNPCKISAYFGTNAHLVLHLNSVSDGAIINVRVDGVSVFTQSVPNLDGKFDVNGEYNRDYTINIAAGKHLVEVRNTGLDWFYLDWLRFENVQPSTYANNWTPSPVSVGVKSPAEAVVYVVSPTANFPTGATNTILPALTNANLRLNNWPAGDWTAIWHDAKTFQSLGKTSSTTTNGVLQIDLPQFSEDIAGRIVPANRVSITTPANSTLTVQLGFPAAAHSTLDSSPDLTTWQTEAPAPFGSTTVTVPLDSSSPTAFLRLNTTE